MIHDPQKLFPHLIAVDSSNKKQRKPWSGQAQTSPLPARVVRMAVMPTLSRNLWVAGVAWVWNFVRGYFVNPRPGGAVVLSFPQSGFVNKKPSERVRWNQDCGAAPQEGGRA